MKKVIIDAGHGINTKGKSSPNCALMEWRYNREIANAIAQGLILREYDAEVIVPELEDVPLKDRVDRVNRIACKYGISESLLLSIHVNAAGNGSQWMNARGWCAYTFPATRSPTTSPASSTSPPRITSLATSSAWTTQTEIRTSSPPSTSSSTRSALQS
mgnify:CR=1 FL=1